MRPHDDHHHPAPPPPASSAYGVLGAAAAATKQFLHRHPHTAHAFHSALHVAYFVGVAVSNFGKFYGLAAGLLAAVGTVAMFRQEES